MARIRAFFERWLIALTIAVLGSGAIAGGITFAPYFVLGSTTLTLGATTTTVAGLTLTSPTLTTPVLGTPSSGVATNLTSIPVANATGVLPAANGGAGTINGALAGNGSGTVSQAACANLSNGATGCSTTVGTIATQNYTATTWTPVVTTDATVGTPAYTRQAGNYEQVGRHVTVRFDIILSGWTGSPTGNVSISGLPVAAATDRGDCSISVWATSTALIGVWGDVSAGASTIRLLSTTAAAASQGLLTATQSGTTLNLSGFCTYHT